MLQESGPVTCCFPIVLISHRSTAQAHKQSLVLQKTISNAKWEMVSRKQKSSRCASAVNLGFWALATYSYCMLVA
eukprot:4329655-Amphidinium_carterae.1